MNAVLRGCLRRSAAALAVFSTAGCATTWDDLTSNRFWDEPAAVLFEDPEPMEVLRSPDSTGDQVARALGELEEPLPDGGTPEQQAEVLALLEKHATSDDRALCRLAAINKLGEFRDPRAGEILVTAYYSVTPDRSSEEEDDEEIRFTKAAGETLLREAEPPLFDLEPAQFSPEMVEAIRGQALAAMGGVPGEKTLPVLVEAAEPREDRDIRLAAIRALGEFPIDKRAAEPLVTVLRNEDDPALRDSAYDGLVRMTGDAPDAARQIGVLVEESGPSEFGSGRITPVSASVPR